ncbi:MAG: PepSY domain-containing protein [Clostridia bacterium]|nr:PepSY domain-containing protein [Clostridia bacterium]
MNNKTEKDLSSAVEKLIPEDMYERIEKGIVREKERTELMTAIKKRTNYKALTALIAACFILVLGIGGAGYYRNTMMVASIVDIDVNPSVEISVNRNDRVIDVKAVNSDGVDLLDGMELKNTDLDVAVNAIIGAMVKKGYFNGDNSQILVTVQNNDSAKASEIRTLVVSDIDAALKANSAGAAILNQTVSADSDAQKLAKEQGISLGKAVFVLNLAALGEGLDPAELSKMSLSELTALVREKGLDVGKIIDYDADDSLFENIADGIEDANEALSPVVLTAADAKAAALAAAGVNAADASFIKAELERDDGRAYYEIKFRAGNTVYEFEINAETGAVEDREEDREKTAVKEHTAKLTAEEAKAKAIAHAGVNAADARIIHAELDNDDGIPVYEVEFIVGNTEYDYEIHAVTGEVLSFETETKRSAVTETPAEPTSLITAEEAENIALAHAGVSRADASFERTELDKDDGRSVYEVGFRVGKTEYEYDIDAATGKILEFDKE